MLAMNRALFSSREVLFYCDPGVSISPLADLPSSLKIERARSEAELSQPDLEEIVNCWNPKLASRAIKTRFGQGASLWMIKSEGAVAGFGWTLQGCTIEPHYYRLGPDDVHLFDFFVFPQFRGQGLNPLLVNNILRHLAAEGVGRAFIEAAEWNLAQLSSLKKTPFHRLSRARKLTIFRHTMVWWDESKPLSNSTEGP